MLHALRRGMWKLILLTCVAAGCGKSEGKAAAKAAEKADAKTERWLDGVNKLQTEISIAEISFKDKDRDRGNPDCPFVRAGAKYVMSLREHAAALAASAPAIPPECTKTVADKIAALEAVFVNGVGTPTCEGMAQWWGTERDTKWESAVCDFAMAVNPCVDAARAAGATTKPGRLRSECKK